MIIPEGYVLVPKGGRPPKHARDIAVFLASIWREDAHHEKRWQAHEWAVATWPELGDSANVRKAIRKAKGALPKRGMINVTTAFVMHIEAAAPLIVEPGASGWIWCEGMKDAAKIVASNVKTEGRKETVSLPE